MADHPTPHDAFARAVFSDPQQAIPVLRAVLPEPLLRLLDFSAATLEDRLSTNEELQDRRFDFLYRVSLRGEDAYVLVLLEHQSTVDPIMAARAFFYLGRAVDLLGNGSRVSCADTVPLALWIAAFHLDDYPAAVETAVAAGGDTDTMAAIVGGIVAARISAAGIPPAWREAVEPLPIG